MPSDTIDENPTAPAAPEADAAGSRRLARLVWQVALAAVLVLLVRAFLLETFYVPSGSMEPTVNPGDRVVVDRLHGSADLARGDVVVFDGTQVFGGPDLSPPQASGFVGSTLHGVARALGLDLGEKDYLKRVIGLPGDHVVCCTADGRLSINGAAVTEPYLPAGMPASEVTFDLVIPADRLFVLGDNRADSADSRAHLGDPGGGMVPLEDVIGQAVLRYWPLSQVGSLPSTTAFLDVPKASS